LYIACGNLLVNVDQQQDLQRQTQNKTDSVRINVTFWYGYVTMVEFLKKYVVHTLSACL